MIIQDCLLVRAKLKDRGMTVKELANKIHTSPNKLEKILSGKDNSRIIEERVIKWLLK